MSAWKMPKWMKPFEPYFNDRGALSVEASMNLYGAKCGNRLATADPDLHALIINAQVGMLVALQGAGMLGGGKPAPGSDTPTKCLSAFPDGHPEFFQDQSGKWVCRACGKPGHAPDGEQGLPLAELAEKVDDLFEVPMAVFREGSQPWGALKLLRSDIAQTLAGKPRLSLGEIL